MDAELLLHILTEIRIFVVDPETHLIGSPVAKYVHTTVPRQGEYFSIMGNDHEIFKVEWDFIEGKQLADVFVSGTPEEVVF